MKLAVTKVLLVEDHPIVRHGLSSLIAQENDMTVCGEAETVTDALELLSHCHPDVILVDLCLRQGTGLEFITAVRDSGQMVPTLVVSTRDRESHAPEVMRAGALGFINKHEAVDKIVEAIRCVRDGHPYVAHQDREADHSMHWFG